MWKEIRIGRERPVRIEFIKQSPHPYKPHQTNLSNENAIRFLVGTSFP